eukprot:gb/GEZN01008435.1/.p1 GENE.gb/GEZN01008435.1/~~gb/GEZN01008435.1/.p1  ORF type:complete len:445 (+),score=29.72 gb/GEZN01008435.1/:65-1336(+)
MKRKSTSNKQTSYKRIKRPALAIEPGKTNKKQKISLGAFKQKSSIDRSKKEILSVPLSAGVEKAPVLFEGAGNFRMRLVCATLASRPIRISKIRELEENPGIRDYEASFLRLLDKLTNGSVIKINMTGTTVRYQPGMLVGGHDLDHDCPVSRSVGYFLEPLVFIAPFCKVPITLTLRGITNENQDTSVDILRTCTFPLLRKFGVTGEIVLKVKKRGAPPLGGGEVDFSCPTVRSLKPVDMTEIGKIRRFRGMAYTTKCSPQIGNRLVQAARSILNHWIADVHIYTDHYKGKNSGSSPGFGIGLAAESTSGCLTSAELYASADSPGQLPEDVAKKCAAMLCEQLAQDACVDTVHQPTVLLLMVLCPEDVSKVRVGPLSDHTIQCLRLFRDLFGVTFQILPDPKNLSLVLSCQGIGYTNLALRTA